MFSNLATSIVEIPAVNTSRRTLKLKRNGIIGLNIRKPSSIPCPYAEHISASDVTTPAPGTVHNTNELKNTAATSHRICWIVIPIPE